MPELYFHYWGKSAPKKEQSDKMLGKPHLLVYHLMDVAACGKTLLDRNVFGLRSVASWLGMSEDVWEQFVVWGLLIHDSGKFTRAFQKFIGNPLFSSCPVEYQNRHDELGLLLWDQICINDKFAAQLAPLVLQSLLWMDLLMPFVAHHGRPKSPGGNRLAMSKDDQQALVDWCITAASLCEVDLSSVYASAEEHTSAFKLISWLAAGMADWLGSSRKMCLSLDQPSDIAQYWKEALFRASRAVDFTSPWPSSKESGVASLFDYISEPTPLQQAAEAAVVPAGKPQLWICEDSTGSGKTEAAMLLARRLMQANCGQRIFFALPTMATSNAMYERGRRIAKKLFADNAKPIVRLAHGHSYANAVFRSAVEACRTSKDQDAALFRWVASSAKMSLMADIGFGTIDQALMATLPLSHQDLRCVGLFGTILIVDEVHSYDPYVNSLLKKLLTWHAENGGSAILLSATLYSGLRKQLIEAFASGCAVSKKQMNISSSDSAFPLLTHYSEKLGVVETAISPKVGSQRTIGVKWLHSERACLEKLLCWAREGRCALWIRNTVREANAAYDLLRKAAQDVDVIVFHSRFVLEDRATIEQRLVDSFGPQSGPSERKGRIVIATQVAEQSLDVDFDELITDLAPIDNVLQRVGRYRRHTRNVAGERSPQEGRGCAEIFVHAPEFSEDAQWIDDLNNFGGTQRVYADWRVLWLTQRQLSLIHRQMKLPDEMRELVEGVYAELDKCPSWLDVAARASEAASFEKIFEAEQWTVDFDKGYSEDSNSFWNAGDKNISTRLQGLTTTVSFAKKLPSGDIVPYAAGGWAVSTIPIPTWWIKQNREQLALKSDISVSALTEKVVLFNRQNYSPICGFLGES